jgi:hypothetical protein
MDSHIYFVEETYSILKKPIHYIACKINSTFANNNLEYKRI